MKCLTKTKGEHKALIYERAPQSNMWNNIVISLMAKCILKSALKSLREDP